MSATLPNLEDYKHLLVSNNNSLEARTFRDMVQLIHDAVKLLESATDLDTLRDGFDTLVEAEKRQVFLENNYKFSMPSLTTTLYLQEIVKALRRCREEQECKTSEQELS